MTETSVCVAECNSKYFFSACTLCVSAALLSDLGRIQRHLDPILLGPTSTISRPKATQYLRPFLRCTSGVINTIAISIFVFAQTRQKWDCVRLCAGRIVIQIKALPGFVISVDKPHCGAGMPN